MRIFITGITGFAGGHLADYLAAKKGMEVYGLAHRESSPKRRIYACDVRDSSQVASIVRKVKPDRIFHLAAQSSVSFSWEHPKETFEQNLIGTINVLEAARKTGRSIQIQIAGSAHEYGVPPRNGIRIDESMAMSPLSPYAVSKAAQDLLACQYYAHYGMKIVRTRAFNHIGPRQTSDFVTSSFARQVALIEAGRQKPEIFVGNLDTIRDYTDVRDVVRAYWLSLEKGKAGEVYNIASGKGRTARQILDYYLKVTPVKIKVKQKASRMRPSDPSRLVGDASKFKLKTGWEPRIPFEKSLKDILQFWREKIK